jgi:hypothetical protein
VWHYCHPTFTDVLFYQGEACTTGAAGDRDHSAKNVTLPCLISYQGFFLCPYLSFTPPDNLLLQLLLPFDIPPH